MHERSRSRGICGGGRREVDKRVVGVGGGLPHFEF
jgi:hypothetical protein